MERAMRRVHGRKWRKLFPPDAAASGAGKPDRVHDHQLEQ
ncbi:hypothetical protein I551_8345 [Mycobacterium ulcerans str. Harvey]|uniref:Uncharacterized protein n=1 Tax=Mycobacterium ulcerans str. Harvey TaxID=1299332 RepID=A0ABN0QKZ5_MYCUL|nr:hypothetical protein I551_8345 [Mycobacterium ulcerans str. Harvey]